MSDIMIHNMELPKSCKTCPFGDHITRCLIPGDWEERYYMPEEGRSEYCPLQEISTPHGRLVDAKEMFFPFVIEGQKSKRYKIGQKWELNGEEIRKIIDSLPTVIPENKE